ncbi:MAG: adenosylcobalamin-dependent ribonucleoside-diphosphate reductase [Candidatus Thiodiazotropha sp.]
MHDPFDNQVSRDVWLAKYCLRDETGPLETSVDESWRRVADAVASVEGAAAEKWAGRFYDLLCDFRFLPGGRILAGAGSSHQVTLFNCFVMGTIEDSMDGIFTALKEGALTMQQGGGVGYDFSTLRPRGAPARHAGTISSGPVSFMRIWDSMCETLLSTGNRRGAMMATLRCDHPDIESFIEVKRDPRELRNFNLSVLVTDEFMQAVKCDREWPLRFPLLPDEEPVACEEARWSGREGAVSCRVYARVSARKLWRRIMRATYDMAEPGVLFIDHINRENNLHYCERIEATNPCGEIPLPPYGACDLGSLNLTAYVLEPFTSKAAFDETRFRQDVAVAVRFLDNVIELSRFPLASQQRQAGATRRIGLGATGLADVLMMLGMRYGDERSLNWVDTLFRLLRDTAYQASCELAQEKGAFPRFRSGDYLAGAYSRRLPPELRQRIARGGMRNSHLLAVAPTGTISLLANNVSSGLEPVFDYSYRRSLRGADGSLKQVELEDYAWRLWRSRERDAAPIHFVTASDIAPEDHLAIQARIQPYVDNAISKTINVPESIEFEHFSSLYQQAYLLGLKGCTTFRPNAIRGEVLSSGTASRSTESCCMTD